MNFNDIMERFDISNHLISMTPVEKIVELGYIFDFNENTKVLDLCCGYGEMLSILGRAFKISGKGIDLNKEFIEIGNERLKKHELSGKIVLQCDDAKKCAETGYDMVILTETYIYDSIEGAIKECEKYIKANGKIVLGMLVSRDKEIPEELKDFDGINLYTELEIYETILKNGYSISFIGRSTQGEWDKYFVWDSRRTVKNYQTAKTEEEKEKSLQWLNKWYKMYAKFRIKYEQWCIFALEKI